MNDQQQHGNQQKDAARVDRVQHVVKTRSREEAAQFIEKQMNWETNASMEKQRAHYGFIELQELMDFIYNRQPKNDDEKIKTAGIGWH